MKLVFAVTINKSQRHLIE